jgi:hypothetical protein
LTAEETRSYVQQRLRIAGSNGQSIFEGEALDSIHRYSNGIPRVVNLICEHCLVSAFVDQQKTVTGAIVDAVARDFDLGDNHAVPPPAPPTAADKFDLVMVKSSNLAERLEGVGVQGGNYEPNSRSTEKAEQEVDVAGQRSCAVNLFGVGNATRHRQRDGQHHRHGRHRASNRLEHRIAAHAQPRNKLDARSEDHAVLRN